MPPMSAVRGCAEDAAIMGDDLGERSRRRLHDTVLQSLELVAGGVAGSPATLADAQQLARRAADELRQWLDGSEGGPSGTLADAVRRVATDAREHAPHAIEVVVGRDDAAVPAAIAAEVAAAVGEALTNARKHAQASRVVVFCEDLDGQAVVTVRDDGIGASISELRAGRGVSGSIVGRIEEMGGTVEISCDGRGVMVAMRVPARVDA